MPSWRLIALILAIAAYAVAAWNFFSDGHSLQTGSLYQWVAHHRSFVRLQMALPFLYFGALWVGTSERGLWPAWRLESYRWNRLGTLRYCTLRLTWERITLTLFVCFTTLLYVRWSAGLASANQTHLAAFAGALLTGYLTLAATRRLAGSQIGPTLLSRFNSVEMYNARRATSREFLYWYAGDRFQLITYWI